MITTNHEIHFEKQRRSRKVAAGIMQYHLLAKNEWAVDWKQIKGVGSVHPQTHETNGMKGIAASLDIKGYLSLAAILADRIDLGGNRS